MPHIYTRKEVRQRRMRYQVAAGMFDFLAIIAGIVVIAVCVVLLTALVRWVIAESQESFGVFWEIATNALIIPK